ncbi:MAG: hypothetical protein KDJ75_03030 [Alphaproteobacteria bacterium]|nr:hypothetical protein [Alphaproteobacteria bacterium]
MSVPNFVELQNPVWDQKINGFTDHHGFNAPNLMQSVKDIMRHQGIEVLGGNSKVGIDRVSDTKYIEFTVPKEDYAYGRQIIKAMLYEGIDDSAQLAQRIKSIPVPEHITQRQIQKTLEGEKTKGFVDEGTGKKHFLNTETGRLVTVGPDGTQSLHTYDTPDQGKAAFGQLLDDAGKMTGKMPRIAEGGAEALTKAIERSGTFIGKLENVGGDALRFLRNSSRILGPLGIVGAGLEISELREKITEAVDLGLISEAAAESYDNILAGHLTQATVDPSALGGEGAVQAAYKEWTREHDVPPYLREELRPDSVVQDVLNFFSGDPTTHTTVPREHQTIDWIPQHQAVLEAFGPKADGRGTEGFRSQLTDKQAEFLEGVGNPNIMASERSTHIDKFLGSLTEPQKSMLEAIAPSQAQAAPAASLDTEPLLQPEAVENAAATPVTPPVKPAAPVQPSGGIGRKAVEVEIRPETVLGQEPLKDTAGEVIALEGVDKNKVSLRATADPSEVVMSVGGEERTVKKNDLGINDMEALQTLSKESADLKALKQLDAETRQAAPAAPVNTAPANTASASVAATLMNGSGNQISMRGDKVAQLQTLLAQDPELAKAMTYEKDGQAVVVDSLAGARTRGAVEAYAAKNDLDLNTMSVDDLIAHAQNNAALKVSVSADAKVAAVEASEKAPASDGTPVWAEKIEPGSVDGTAPVAGAEHYAAAATREKITSNFNTESSPVPKTPEPVPGQRWDAGMTPLERTLAANNTFG